MSLVRGTNKNGQLVFGGNLRDLRAINDWVQSFMHLSFGLEEGEKKYRQIRLTDALELWCSPPKESK